MPSRLDLVVPWISRAVAAAALTAVVWACVTAWGAIVHGHPTYAIWLAVTTVAAIVSLAWSWRPHAPRSRWRRALRIVGVVGAAAWVVLTAWLRPFPAVEPALGAMASDGAVTVEESPTRIVLEPAGGAGAGVGVVFYAGARVDPRAYAAHLRPIAAAGHEVVIVKEPLGIAFLALGALARVEQGGGTLAAAGHSLGGTVAAMEAVSADADGLVLWASYPAGDMSDWEGAVLSVSGSEDGLSTPERVEESAADLPAGALFTQVDGATHAQFGSYGPQPGDGTAYIGDEDARTEIVTATLAFLDSQG